MEGHRQSHVVPLHIQAASDEEEVTESSFLLIHAQKMSKRMQKALQIEWPNKRSKLFFFTGLYPNLKLDTVTM